MSGGAPLDDGRPLGADDRELVRQLRARDQSYAAAYDEGLRGVGFDPEAWPDDQAVADAYAAGVDERRRRRSEARRATVWAALRWCGRHLAPHTSRRLRRMRRRMRRRARRVRALTGWWCVR